jgi:Protein of unknown function (DUF4197)
VWLTAWPAFAADARLVAALREAMQLAVDRGIVAVARPDGFLGNPAIRIPVPEPLTRIETRLRETGNDRRADKFVASLNHAAERSAPAARPALLTGVAELPLDDGHHVLARGHTAGTELLRRVSVARVIAALSPAVADAMDHVRVARQYKRFVRDSPPLGGLFQQSPVDLDAYVVGRTVDGLFHAIGEEERRIRLEPSARTTPRLREVFGGQR